MAAMPMQLQVGFGFESPREEKGNINIRRVRVQDLLQYTTTAPRFNPPSPGEMQKKKGNTASLPENLNVEPFLGSHGWVGGEDIYGKFCPYDLL